MAAIVTNWFTGLFLILLGLYHIVAGGSSIDRWLRAVEPALSVRQLTMGTLGFQMGGFLAIAIGGAFLLLGSHLPRSFYLYWAVVLLALGGASLYFFRSFHPSQLVVVLAVVLGLFYWLSPGPGQAS